MPDTSRIVRVGSWIAWVNPDYGGLVVSVVRYLAHDDFVITDLGMVAEGDILEQRDVPTVYDDPQPNITFKATTDA